MTDSYEIVVVFGAAIRPDGSPSGAVRRRVAAALNYARGRSVIFLVTGGLGRYPPAEAAVMSNLLREGGVAEHSILQEDKSATTLDSVVNCTAILRGLSGVEILRVMACSDAYHLPRCRILFRLCGVKAGAIPAADGRSVNPRWKFLWFHLREIPAIAVDAVLVLLRRASVGFG